MTARQWEYCIDEKESLVLLQTILTTRGKDRWELVTIHERVLPADPYPRSIFTLVFKRPKD